MNGIRQLVPPPSGYRLKSILQQLEESVFGTGLVKTTGESITWALPCGLETGLVSDPRLPGEGLACYFLRLLDGVSINPGATGPAGPAGTIPGAAAWTEVTLPFSPPGDSGNFLFSVASAIPSLAPQRIVFVGGLGWVRVISVTGTTVTGTVLQRVSELSAPVPIGTLVVPTGPAGIPGGEVFQVATPAITPATGSYVGSVSVSITCSTSGAVIRYTTNGTEPTEFSPAYTTPFGVSVTTTVRAKAFKTGWLISSEASRTYTFSVVVYNVYIGYSPSTILDEAGLLALTNASYDSGVSVSDISGSYYPGAGKTGSDYFFIWVSNALNDPASTTGFQKLPAVPATMAGSGEGFTSTVNGWPYLPLTRDGVPGKLFRVGPFIDSGGLIGPLIVVGD